MRLAILSALAFTGVTAQDPADGIFRWCVEGDLNLVACNDAVDILNALGGAQFKCALLPANVEGGCNDYLDDARFPQGAFADFARGNNVAQYETHRKYGLKGIVSEDDGTGVNSGYTALAIIKSRVYNPPCSADGSNPMGCDSQDGSGRVLVSGYEDLSDLQGARACFTAYGRTAGWQFPIGGLIESDRLPIVNTVGEIPNDIEAVASFFSEVCAPNNEPDNWPMLCSACRGNCRASDVGGGTDPYEDYSGAFLGLQEGACDVAFTKWDPSFITQQIQDSNDYEIMGIWGEHAIPGTPVTYDTIIGGLRAANIPQPYLTLGKNSAPVLLVDPASTTEANMALIQTAFVAASADPTFMDIVRNTVFGSTTQSLLSIPLSDSMPQHMKQAWNNYEGTRESRFPMRWCPLRGEGATCETMVTLMNGGLDLDGNFQAGFETADYEWSCVEEQESEEACLQLIQDGGAELVKLGVNDARLQDTGHKLFDAFFEYGMRAVMAEDYGDDHGDSYYAVAVVRQRAGIGTTTTDTTPGTWTANDLRGKRICSTGYDTNAGWIMPVGTLLNAGVLGEQMGDGTTPNDILAVNDFFSSSCAPQTRFTEGVGICDSCPEHCNQFDLDLYQGFKGAFRCLAEDVGDIAFVKDDTPYQFAEDGYGNAPTPSSPNPYIWSPGSDTNLDQLELLCSDGTKALITGNQNTPAATYYNCNMGKLPSATIATGSHTTHEAFVAAQNTLERAQADTQFRSLFFNNNNQGLLFSRQTVALTKTDAGTADYLGPTYELFQAVENLNEQRGSDGGSPSSSSGLASGEAAGLAFAMLGVGVGLTFLAGFGMKKYRMNQDQSGMTKSTFGDDLMNDVGGSSQGGPDAV
jgi:hypothetical protein